MAGFSCKINQDLQGNIVCKIHEDFLSLALREKPIMSF
jgi:hypothetical protein